MSFLLFCNKSPTQWLQPIHIYYLTVSLVLESEHALVGCSVQDFTRLKSRCWLGCVLSWRLDCIKYLLPSSYRFRQNSFLVAIVQGPQTLEDTYSSLHGPLHRHCRAQQLASSRKEGASLTLVSRDRVLYNST